VTALSLSPILAFAKMTMWEVSRRKLLIAVGVLTLVVIGATGWGFSQIRGTGVNGQPLTDVEVRLIASQTLIVVVFLFAAVLALMSVLVAAPSISGDIESHLMLAMLARPVRRSELLLGKWLGMAALLVLYAAVSGVLELIVVDMTTGYIPPDPVMLVVYVSGVGLVLLTMALLLSTRMAGMTAGIIPLVCYFMAWVGGILGGIGAAIGSQPLIATGVVTRLILPTDGLWRGAVYAMEPATVVAGLRAAGAVTSANPFSATEAPAAAFLAWSVIWFAIMLGLALWSFRRREL
jgi:ABC-type transport system involved in multi-copper enzyme maturation permease subunit